MKKTYYLWKIYKDLLDLTRKLITKGNLKESHKETKKRTLKLSGDKQTVS